MAEDIASLDTAFHLMQLNQIRVSQIYQLNPDHWVIVLCPMRNTSMGEHASGEGFLPTLNEAIRKIMPVVQGLADGSIKPAPLRSTATTGKSATLDELDL